MQVHARVQTQGALLAKAGRPRHNDVPAGSSRCLLRSPFTSPLPHPLPLTRGSRLFRRSPPCLPLCSSVASLCAAYERLPLLRLIVVMRIIYRSRGCAASANSAKSAKSASPSKAHKQSTSSKSGSSKRRGSKDSKRIQEGKRGSGNAAGSPPQSGGDGREAAAAGGDGVATWAGNNSAAGLAEQRDAAVHSSQQKIKVVLANQ